MKQIGDNNSLNNLKCSRVKGITTFTVKYTEAIVIETKLMYSYGTSKAWQEQSLPGCPSGNYVSCSTNLDFTATAPGTKVYYYFRMKDSFDRIKQSTTYSVTVA